MHSVDQIDILIPHSEVQSRVIELGQEISSDYVGKDLLLIAVLKGAVVFLSDLMRNISVPHAVDFMAISSYGRSTRTTGVVRILMDLDEPIDGREVLIVEDIVDTGRTMDYLLRIIGARQPASLRVCTLLNKPSRREIEVPLDYVGFDIPNRFVYGYGLDLEEFYRNLKDIAALTSDQLAAMFPEEA